MEKYQFVQDIGSGSFGVARLMWNKETREFVAVKFIERGSKIDENVAREILNLRSLRHPNIVSFKEVILTQTHLGIVMEFVAGGQLFERIYRAGRFGEDEARYFFQQLISGVSYCHSMQICHRDLKPENILLDGSPALCLKICDFGCSKSFLLYSRAKSRVGTLVYTAPEVLSGQEYDAKLADVWSCGVILYFMLVGAYPSQDQNIGFNYKILENLHISRDCMHLLAWILVPNPSKRLAIKDIKRHPWFLKKLPRCLTEEAQATYYRRDNTAFSLQSVDEIMKIVREATGDASV